MGDRDAHRRNAARSAFHRADGSAGKVPLTLFAGLLIAGFAALAVPGVAAAATSVSAVSVSASPSTAGASATYSVDFTTSASGALTALTGTVTLVAPCGTVFPSTPTTGYSVNGTLALLVTASSSTGCSSANQVTITLDSSVAASTKVTVSASSVTNPAAGTYTMDVSTSADTAAAQSTSYTISSSGSGGGSGSTSGSVGSVTGPAPTPPAASATAVAYAIGFTTSSSGSLVAGTGTITLDAPGGTVFPSSASDYQVNGTPLAVAPVGGGSATVTMVTPVAVGASSNVVLDIVDVTNPAAGSYTMDVSTSGDTTAASTPGYTIVGGYGYFPLTPARICDTRPPSVSGVTDQCSNKTLGPASTLAVTVVGNGGVPSSGAAAVVMNVTVTDTTSGGYLTLWPAGATRPLASNLNWSKGETVANLVTVPLGTGGVVDAYNFAGQADVVMDVEGYEATVSGLSGLYDALAPSRICDTRPPSVSGVTDQCSNKTLGPASTLAVTVAGNGGVPSTGAAAVVMNVTVTGTTSGGYLTLWPAGATRPLASNLNWSKGETVANLVTVPLGTGGVVDAYNFAGQADVVVDVEGYYTSGTVPDATGGLFEALTPSRICDTRPPSVSGVTDQCSNKTLGPASTLAVTVAGNGGVPSTGAAAVVMNVTVTDTTSGGYLTLWPAGTTRPLASNVNWPPGATVPNLVTVPLGTGGVVDAYNFAGQADVVMDVEGWYTAAI